MIEKVSRKELYGDGIGFVEEYDFSTANSSKEARIEAITQVASVCYD
ncbi:MAG: FAD-dependent thymidylate synthase, partial [Ignavibacteriae bacterium]|nr:FAD-dependent thymidylate synthase [Ignavibacteriota bacterium]